LITVQENARFVQQRYQLPGTKLTAVTNALTQSVCTCFKTRQQWSHSSEKVTIVG